MIPGHPELDESIWKGISAGVCQTVQEGWLLRVGDLLSRMVWLDEDSSPTDPKGTRGESFFHCGYRAVLQQVLEKRREGKSTLVGFCNAAIRREFYDRHDRYESEGKLSSSTTGRTANGLPVLLFWALGLLRNSLGVDDQLSDKILMATAFDVASRVREAHHRTVSLAFHRQKSDAAWTFAGDIVSRLEELEEKFGVSPVLRDIVRRFGRQKKSRFMPVMDVLIEVGVIEKNSDGSFASGVVDLTEVELEVRERLDMIIRVGDDPNCDLRR